MPPLRTLVPDRPPVRGRQRPRRPRRHRPAARARRAGGGPLLQPLRPDPQGTRPVLQGTRGGPGGLPRRHPLVRLVPGVPGARRRRLEPRGGTRPQAGQVLEPGGRRAGQPSPAQGAHPPPGGFRGRHDFRQIRQPHQVLPRHRRPRPRSPGQARAAQSQRQERPERRLPAPVTGPTTCGAPVQGSGVDCISCSNIKLRPLQTRPAGPKTRLSQCPMK